MKILGIIPARYASNRLPAKALVDIEGKPMVQRVYEQALKCESLSDVVVATDHPEIFSVVNTFGKAVMTAETHQSGTDRCAEVLENQTDEYDFVINIQGDEPFIKPEQVDLLANTLSQDIQLATLVKLIEDSETLFNSNTPKVVLNRSSEAVYFSRSTIPFIRNYDKEEWLKSFNFYKHIGIYAYRSDILREITKLEQSPLEKAESLEQLRWIENGYKIKVAVTEFESMGIDTREDLDKAREIAKNFH